MGEQWGADGAGKKGGGEGGDPCHGDGAMAGDVSLAMALARDSSLLQHTHTHIIYRHYDKRNTGTTDAVGVWSAMNLGTTSSIFI